MFRLVIAWDCLCDNRVELAPGVEYVRTADVKDQIELSGNDIQAVSMTGQWLLSFNE